MESSPSVWNDLSPKEKKMMELMSTIIHTTLEEKFDQRRRENEERRLRKELDKRILEKASRNREHHGRKEKTLRENHERREREEHERRRKVHRWSGSERVSHRLECELKERILREMKDLRVKELKEKELREKELKEKELREKELKEKELKEQEKKERKLRDEQEKELCDILVVNTNPCFVFHDSHLKDDVEMTPKEEIQDNNFLCEDVEEIELKAHGEVVCDIPYKNPFTLVPSGELSTKFPWSTHHEENEAPMELEQPLEKICLSLDTLFTSNLNNIKHFTLDSFGIKPWIMIEFANLEFLIVPINHCFHDVEYFFRLLEEPKKEGTPQISKPSEEIWIKEQMSTQVEKGEETLKNFGYTINEHFNSFFPSLHCVVDMNRLYTLLLNLKLEKVCLIFDPGGIFIVGEGQVNLGTS